MSFSCVQKPGRETVPSIGLKLHFQLLPLAFLTYSKAKIVIQKWQNGSVTIHS